MIQRVEGLSTGLQSHAFAEAKFARHRDVYVEIPGRAQAVVAGIPERPGGVRSEQARIQILIEDAVRRTGVAVGGDDVRPVVPDSGQRIVFAAGRIDR